MKPLAAAVVVRPEPAESGPTIALENEPNWRLPGDVVRKILTKAADDCLNRKEIDAGTTFSTPRDAADSPRLDLPRLMAETRALIAAGFCKGRTAAAADGSTVGALSDRAASFDVMGALKVAAHRQGVHAVPTAATFLIRKAMAARGCRPEDTICDMVDRPETVQADVLAILDEAIRTVPR